MPVTSFFTVCAVLISLSALNVCGCAHPSADVQQVRPPQNAAQSHLAAGCLEM